MISAGSPSILISKTLTHRIPVITPFILPRFWKVHTHETKAKLKECLHTQLACKQATTWDHLRRYDDLSWWPINSNQRNLNLYESRHNTAHYSKFLEITYPLNQGKLEECLHSELAHKQATTWDHYRRYGDLSRLPIKTNQWNFNSSESRHNTAHHSMCLEITFPLNQGTIRGMFTFWKLECGTWYHHPQRLQCVLSRNLSYYRCRHNLKNNCIWDNLQCCLLMLRSPIMLTFDL